MTPKIHLIQDEQGDFLLEGLPNEASPLTPGTILIVEEGPKGTLRLRVQRPRPILREKEGVLVAQVKAWDDLTHVVPRERQQRLQTLLQQTGL